MTNTLIHIDRDDCLVLERSMTREWLETDGRGGYAASTILMCPTRRYHGLLVAPPPGQVDRHVFLARFEETFHGEAKSFAISMARYPGQWSPLGQQGIEHFELAPYPGSVYRFGSARLERDVLMVRGEHTVLVRYRVTGQHNAVSLRLRPLLPYRNAHQLTFENPELDMRIERIERGIVAQPYRSLPPIAITTSSPAHFEADPSWYKNLEYQADIARGYPGHEDQFNPGCFEIELEPGVDVFVAATIGNAVQDPAAVWARESAARRRPLASREPSVRTVLEIEAEHFLYRTDQGRLGVIAGYPWFGEWGRDTFISLPGLLLARGRTKECGEALRQSLDFLRDGLMPNVFGTSRADSQYNSVDASLWFARAVRLYELAAGEGSGAAFRTALVEIATFYKNGTALGIRGDESGLLRAGGPAENVTWMDARTEDGPVTPRAGFAVEINALWYFLLAYLEDLERRSGNERQAVEWGRAKRDAGRAFVERFWLADEHYLADVWNDGELDRSVRPNMVIAAALEWSPLSRGMRTDVVKHATAVLLTPLGLRSLEPGEPKYNGRYGGTSRERDEAYHQGAVWPWLIGSYCEAYLRAYGPRPQRIDFLRSLLDGFEVELARYGLAHVSEVLDGDPPHRPGGTFAQAWSTAEILRAYRMLDEARR